MGGRACGVLSWVSFLLFPHPLYVVGGVAGWNITPGVERVSARCWVLRRHLPVGGLFFLVAAPGLDRLTHPVGAPCWGGWVWWWLWWVSGCGGVLSVA
jgi:hypothetical protein